MLTLAVTTSTALVGVAIADDDTLLASESVLTDRRHAEEITPLISRMLGESGVELAELNRLVVDVGPGRFTGLRVGLATAKSIAFALGVGVIPVTSFELLWSTTDGAVIAVVDARRAEVFVQERASDGTTTAPLVCAPEDLVARLQSESRRAVLLGDGADRYHDLFVDHDVVRDKHPDVVGVAVDPPADRLTEPAKVTPVYLRDADVKINIATRPVA